MKHDLILKTFLMTFFIMLLNKTNVIDIQDSTSSIQITSLK